MIQCKTTKDGGKGGADRKSRDIELNGQLCSREHQGSWKLPCAIFDLRKERGECVTMRMERLPFCFPLDLKGIVNSHSRAGKSWNSWRGLAKSKEGGKKALEKGHKTSLSFLQFPGNTR